MVGGGSRRGRRLLRGSYLSAADARALLSAERKGGDHRAAGRSLSSSFSLPGLAPRRPAFCLIRGEEEIVTSTQGHRLPSVAKARINPGPSGRGVSLRRPPSPCAPPPPRPPPPPHVPHSTPTYRFAQLQIRGQEGGAGSMRGRSLPEPSGKTQGAARRRVGGHAPPTPGAAAAVACGSGPAGTGEQVAFVVLGT